MESLVKIPHSELNATLERLSNLGVTQEHFRRLRSIKEYANAVAKAFRGNDRVKMDYGDVRAILGQDFIAPEEIAQARKLVYSKDLLKHFAETLPSDEVLRWLRDIGFVLIAGTPEPMSLLEIRNLNIHLFYNEEGGWYADSRHKFSRDDKVTAEWLMLRKGIVPDSTRKTWEEQQRLFTEVEYVPNVAETIWGETTYNEVRDSWLFPNIYARTSSVVSSGVCVIVGISASDGVVVGGDWNEDRLDDIGVSSARKLNLKS